MRGAAAVEQPSSRGATRSRCLSSVRLDRRALGELEIELSSFAVHDVCEWGVLTQLTNPDHLYLRVSTLTVLRWVNKIFFSRLVSSGSVATRFALLSR